MVCTNHVKCVGWVTVDAKILRSFCILYVHPVFDEFDKFLSLLKFPPSSSFDCIVGHNQFNAIS